MTVLTARFELDGIETMYQKEAHPDNARKAVFVCPCGWRREHDYGDRMTEFSLRWHYDHCGKAQVSR